MTDSPPQGSAPRKGGRRTAARTMAVQALYQIEMSGAAAADVIQEFRQHRLTDPASGAPDAKLFAALVAAASTRREDIDALIVPALAEDWKLERLDAVIRALLRAGVAELVDFADTPARVIIDEYLHVAHSFFPARETGFVNGVLDRLARRLRSTEVGADGPRQEER
jgi:transcription antitermination protein NusB